MKLFSHFCLFIILIVAMSFSNNGAKEYSYILYLSQLFIMYIYLYRKKYLFLYLTPIMLTIFYVDFSFGLGSWAFKNHIVLNSTDYNDYLKWKYNNYITLYVLVINHLLFYLDLLFHKKYLILYNKFMLIFQKKYTLKLIRNIAIIFFIIFAIIPFNVSFLGGSGDMSGVPMTISALVLISLIAYSKSKNRYLIYLLILIIFSNFSYGSKREAIFFIFPILFLEVYLNKINVSIKILFKLLLVGLLLLFLILIMSIMRGYGGYNIQKLNIIEVIPYVFDYIHRDMFFAYLFNNIETNYTFFHSIQAMEYIYNNSNLLSFGSTIIKFLFITIPSSIAPFKPHSIIDLYTSYRNPHFRAIGGSWPPNIYAEMFWNFYYFGIVYVVFIFSIINIIFLKFLKLLENQKIVYHIGFLYFYMQILMYSRGSGLDLFTVYMVFGFFFGYLYTCIVQLIQHKFYMQNIKNYFIEKKIYITNNLIRLSK